MAVATAMPVVAADLDAVREYGFAFSIFLTTVLLGVVVSGTWCDARGPAWPVRTGLVLFGVGLVICGLAGTLGALLVGRAIAGAGGGLLVVALYVVIAGVYPTEVQPRVFSYLSAGWVLPAIVGPAVAGWLAESVTWRAVFLLVPPLTVPPALALLPRLRRLGPTKQPQGAENDAPPSPGRRVVAGLALALGVVTVQWGLDRVSRTGASVDAAGAPAGDAPAATLAALAVGALLVAVTLPRLLPPGTLRLSRGLPTVIAMRGLYAATFFGMETFIPLMLVTQRGLSATQAGLVLTAGAIGWTTGAFLQSRSWMTMPRHLMLFTGGLVLGLGQAGLVLTIRPPVPALVAVPLWIVTAFGMGMGMSSTSVLTLRLSAPGEQGRNSSGLQLSDAVGSAFGIGLTGAAFAAWHQPGGDDADLFTGMWLACAAFAMLAGVAGLRARHRSPVEAAQEPLPRPA